MHVSKVCTILIGLGIVISLFLNSCATCPYSAEKKWLLEDADIHIRFIRYGRSGYNQGYTITEHYAFAKRFREIAEYIDKENLSAEEKEKLKADIVFLRSCLYLHIASNSYNKNEWDKMWIERYERIIKRLERKN